MADIIRKVPNFIEGTLKTPSGIALPGITVSIVDPATKTAITTTTDGGGYFNCTKDLPSGYYYIKFDDPLDRFYIPTYGAALTGQPLNEIEALAQNDIAQTDIGEIAGDLGKSFALLGAGGIGVLFSRYEFENEKTKQYMMKVLQDKVNADELTKFDINHLTSKYNLTREERIEIGKEIERQNYRKVALERLARTKLTAGQITQDQLDKEIASINKGLQVDENRLSPTLREKVQEGNLSDNVNHLGTKFGLIDDEKEQLKTLTRERVSARLQKEQDLRTQLANGKISQTKFASEMKSLHEEFIIDPKKLSPTIRSKIDGRFKQEPKEFQKQIQDHAKNHLANAKINEALISRSDENAQTNTSTYERPTALKTIQDQTQSEKEINIEQTPTILDFPTRFTRPPNEQPTEEKGPQPRTPYNPRRRRGIVDTANNLYNKFRTGRGVASGARTAGFFSRFTSFGRLVGGGARTAATIARIGAAAAPAAVPIAIIVLIILLLLLLIFLLFSMRVRPGDNSPGNRYYEIPGLTLRLEATPRVNVGDTIYYKLTIEYDFAQAIVPLSAITLHTFLPSGTTYISSPGGIYNASNNEIRWFLSNEENQKFVTFTAKAITDNIAINNKVFATTAPTGPVGIISGNSQTLKEIFEQAATANNIPLAYLLAEAKSETGVLSYTDIEARQFSTNGWWVGLPDDAPTVELLNPLIRRGYAYNTCAFPKSDPICPGQDVRGAMQFLDKTWNNTWAGEPVPAGYTPDRRNVRDAVFGSAILFRKAATTWNDEFGFLNNPTDWTESQVRAMAAIYCGGSPYYDTSVRGCGRPGMPYSTIVWLNYLECKAGKCL